MLKNKFLLSALFVFILNSAPAYASTLEACISSFKKQDSNALSLCEPLAKKDPIAQYTLSQIYSKGVGVAPNEGLEILYLNKSANNNYVPAQIKLAEKTLEAFASNQVLNTGKEGLEIAKRAALSKDPEALFLMAKIVGTEDFQALGLFDPEASQQEMLKLYENGYKKAGLYASHNYYDGFGTSINKKEALKILNELAQTGYAPALVALSEIYMNDLDYINFISGYAYYYTYANCDINGKHFKHLEEIKQRLSKKDLLRAQKLGEALLANGCSLEEK